MKNIKSFLLLIITSLSMNCSAMTGRNAQKFALNFGGIIAANRTANIAYAEKQNNDKNASDYIDSVKYPEFAKFAKKHRCSPEIEKLVRKNQSKKTHVQNGVYKYDRIPFYNKGNDFDRIIYAEEIKTAIKENNLDCLNVPDKCVCHMYGAVWNVIAKESKPQKKDSILSLIQVQQLITIIQQTGYGDTHSKNLSTINENTLMIIDTEARGFATFKSHYINTLKYFYEQNNFTSEAHIWLAEHINSEEALLNNLSSQLYRILTLLYGPDIYKKPDINPNHVYHEHCDYQNHKNQEKKS